MPSVLRQFLTNQVGRVSESGRLRPMPFRFVCPWMIHDSMFLGKRLQPFGYYRSSMHVRNVLSPMGESPLERICLPEAFGHGFTLVNRLKTDRLYHGDRFPVGADVRRV
jgi:hypothetical protein